MMRTTLFPALFLPLLALSGSAQETPTLTQRLERLTETLEEARVEAHVPGMSLAVVLDDEIVYARGFGFADLEQERPATPETIYPIGSTTKAMTATLAGMLVDEGKLDWDDAVTDYLPYFDLDVRSEDEDAACTLRDLLSHRHGFARMGMLWVGGEATREKILRTAAGAEPFDDFRAGFHYCNVTYLAAGMAVGVADETTWDEMMVDRLFTPLSMEATTLAKADVVEDPRLAVGYRWEAADEAHVRERFARLDPIGPAGSVNSNVLDMAQWVRLLLGRGEVDEMRLISESSLRETWSPQIPIGGDRTYGLGWMLGSWGGSGMVEHGGNIGGFSAEVGLLPERGLGFVLLTNLSMASLQQSSLGIVFEALLGDWEEETPIEAGAPAAIAYDEFGGTYVANFASFRDEEFEVRVQESGLALHIPSQQTFALRDPDAEGRWEFALTDTIAITFDRDDAGAVVGLTLHQGGYSFEVPKKGVAASGGADPEELARYGGTYRLEGGDKEIELSVRGGRLVMEDRGMLLAFEDPGEDGRANLRARPEQGATFQFDESGRVIALLFHGDAGDRLFERLQGDDEVELPTVAEVLELRNVEQRMQLLAKRGGTRVTGEVWIAQAGLRGEVTVLTSGENLSTRLDFGEFGVTHIVRTESSAARYTPMEGVRELKGLERAQLGLEHPRVQEGDWREVFDSARVVRADELDGKSVWVVRLVSGELPPLDYWVDAENGDLLRIDMSTVEGPLRIPTTTTYHDFEEIEGFRRAKRVEAVNPASGRTVMTFDSLESGLELADDAFRVADPRRAESGAGR